MNVFLGVAAFAGAIAFVAALRSALIGSAEWRPGSATRLALGLPLGAAVGAVALAFESSSRDAAGGGLAGLALPAFLLWASRPACWALGRRS